MRRTVLLAVALLSAACGGVVPTPPSAAAGAAVVVGSDAGPLADVTPTGAVRVAYPDEPAGLLDLAGDDPAASDLNALWGLPLFELDTSGQLVPALVRSWEVVPSVGDAVWTVQADLASGTWSDGREVSAADVVATVDALRGTVRGPELAPLVDVAVEDADTVRLGFDRPYARWTDLLEGVGVLPAHVLDEVGLEAYADAVPVAGGRFVLAARDPGRSFTFAAHPGSALDAPGVRTVELLVVPRYEASLGLLADGGAQMALGYVALNGARRARDITSIDAEEPTGGTWVALTWRPDARDLPDAATRTAVRDAVDMGQLVDGLLHDDADVLDVPLPRRTGPRTDRQAVGQVPDLTLVTPKWQEALAFTGRAAQRDLRGRGADVSLIAEGSPRFVSEARRTGQAAIRILRTGPRPSLTRWVGERQLEAVVAGDAASVDGEALEAALDAVDEAALIAPLYRPTVTHAWHEDLTGVTPSAWPGLAFAGIADWTWTGSGS